MKKKPRSTTHSTAKAPVKKAQTGDGSEFATFRFFLPPQFLLLCKLLEVTPRQMLSDFMENMSHGSWKRDGRDLAKEKLRAYTAAAGYGSKRFTAEEIEQMFKELDAIGFLFPKNAKAAMLDLHAAWREKYHQYWFEKWDRPKDETP